MIKVIETVYNGYRFRSRLEARWAVFFDALDVKYEYEKEGFDIDGIWYLPDFYLPDYNCWVEIKPKAIISDEDNKKINAFAKNIKDKFIIIYGLPRKYKFITEDHKANYYIKILAGDGFMDNEVWTNEEFVFALARRAEKPELCLLTEFAAINLITNSTDDGERWPISFGLGGAYTAAMQACFVLKGSINGEKK